MRDHAIAVGDRFGVWRGGRVWSGWSVTSCGSRSSPLIPPCPLAPGWADGTRPRESHQSPSWRRPQMIEVSTGADDPGPKIDRADDVYQLTHQPPKIFFAGGQGAPPVSLSRPCGRWGVCGVGCCPSLDSRRRASAPTGHRRRSETSALTKVARLDITEATDKQVPQECNGAVIWVQLGL